MGGAAGCLPRQRRSGRLAAMLSRPIVEAAVAVALREDLAYGDLTTDAVVSAGRRGRARILAREPLTLCGAQVAAHAFWAVDPDLAIELGGTDGDAVTPPRQVMLVAGAVRSILAAERVALNFLQHLSGVATVTAAFCAAVAGTGAAVCDTRKTTPGLRDLEKYAVRCGGGRNHRRDLADMAMIKDNHREAIARQGGDLAGAVAAIRARAPDIPVEIEIDALDQLDEALAARPDWILLDNMSAAELREAVAMTAGRARLEASGGVTLARAAEVAATGVDALSAGALTHSAPALDLSLDIAFAG